MRSRRDEKHLGEIKQISPRTLRDFGEISSNLRACLHGGEGPQVGVVTR